MPSEVTVAIIGGGVSGICVASRLAATMPDATMLLLEREAEIGGTWHAAANYPGAACDVPSHFYSYSFAQNPSWSRRFAPAAEIKAYLQGVAARFGVMPHVRVSTKLEGAVWDEAASRWVLTAVHLPTGTRTVLRAHFLVSCVGALYVPNTPDIKGKESFPAGAAFHSARWNWSVPLEGKRIAVIGTGASAAQFVPQIAAQAGTDITVFQRNAPVSGNASWRCEPELAAPKQAAVAGAAVASLPWRPLQPVDVEALLGFADAYFSLSSSASVCLPPQLSSDRPFLLDPAAVDRAAP